MSVNSMNTVTVTKHSVLGISKRLNLLVTILCALALQLLLVPKSAISAPIYDYVYSGSALTDVIANSPFLGLFGQQPPTDGIKIEILSPTLLLPSTFDQSVNMGLKISMPNGSPLPGPLGDLDSANLYFTQTDSRGLPTAWLINLSFIDEIDHTATTINSMGSPGGYLDDIEAGWGVKGWMTASGMDSGSWQLAAVPEPSTLFLFGAGFVALAGFAALRRKKLYV